MNFNQIIRKGRECGTKIKHPTREAAEKAKVLMEQDMGIGFNIYMCPWCHKFHIGHKDENYQERKR